MNYHEYLSAKEITEQYPFTIGQLRYYLTMRHLNGLEKAVRKIGKRIYLRRDLLELWIESQSSPKFIPSTYKDSQLRKELQE